MATVHDPLSLLDPTKPKQLPEKEESGVVSVTVSVKGPTLQQGIAVRLRQILDTAGTTTTPPLTHQRPEALLPETSASVGASVQSDTDTRCDQSGVSGEDDSLLDNCRREWAVHNHEVQLIEALREIESLDMAIAWAKGARNPSAPPVGEAQEALHILTKAMSQQSGTDRPKAAAKSSAVQTDYWPAECSALDSSTGTPCVDLNLSRDLDNSPPTKQSPTPVENMQEVRRVLDESNEALVEAALADDMEDALGSAPQELTATGTDGEADELESTLVLSIADEEDAAVSEPEGEIGPAAADTSLHLQPLVGPQGMVEAATPGKASMAATEAWDPAPRLTLASRQKTALLRPTEGHALTATRLPQLMPAWGGGNAASGRCGVSVGKGSRHIPAGLSYVAMINELAAQMAHSAQLPACALESELEAQTPEPTDLTEGPQPVVGAAVSGGPEGDILLTTRGDVLAMTVTDNSLIEDAVTETEVEVAHPLRPGMTVSLETFLRSQQQQTQRQRPHLPQPVKAAVEAKPSRKIHTPDHLRVPTPKWVPSLDMLRVSTRGADSYQELFHIRQEGRAKLSLLQQDYAEGQHTRQRVDERLGKLQGSLSPAFVSPPLTARSKCHAADARQAPASAPPAILTVPSQPVPRTAEESDSGSKSMLSGLSGKDEGLPHRSPSLSPEPIWSAAVSETASTVVEFSPVSPRRLNISPTGGTAGCGAMLSPQKSTPWTDIWRPPIRLRDICGEEIFSLVDRTNAHPLAYRFFQWKRFCGWNSPASVVLHEVRRAREDIAVTPKSDLSALHCFTHPPKAVRRALEALAIVLSDGKVPRRWTQVLSLLRSERLKAELLMFRPGRLSPQVIRRLQEDYLDHPDFNCSEISRASHALGPVLRWIKAMVSYGVYRIMLLCQDHSLREDVRDMLHQEGPPGRLSQTDIAREHRLNWWRQRTMLGH